MATTKVKPVSTKPASTPAYQTQQEKDAAAKEEPKGRIHHPALDVHPDTKEPTVTLDAVPADYDTKLHLPLRRIDFTRESVYFRHQAAHYRQVADRMDEQAALMEKYGSKKAQQTAKKLSKLEALKAALEAELAKEGAVK